MDHDAANAFREFVAVIQALRTPGTGCPWDLEQTHQTLRPYLVEEAYEVLDAIDRNDDPALQEELGDLLLQVVLHAQLAADRGAFDIAAVVRGITAKMVRRHPHVFGTTPARDADEVRRNWEAIKAAEKQGKPTRVPSSLPALLRAQCVAKAHGGPVDAAALGREVEQIRDAATLGAVLFELCRLARQLGLNAEECLRDHTTRVEQEGQTP